MFSVYKAIFVCFIELLMSIYFFFYSLEHTLSFNDVGRSFFERVKEIEKTSARKREL